MTQHWHAIAGLCIRHPTRDEVCYHDNGSNGARLQRYLPATGQWSTHAVFDMEGGHEGD